MSDLELERRLTLALHAAAPVTSASRDAIMERVRLIPVADRPRRHGGLLGRGMRHSVLGLAFAAGLGSVTTLSMMSPSGAGVRSVGAVSSVVLGDTVVNRLRDTLRLVRLMFRDSTARHVAIRGDFNRWNERGAVMHRDARSGQWTVTLALSAGDHRYAIVVDDTRWAGRLHVPRSTD